MIQLDSLKHMDICQLVIDVLQGEDVLKKEKEEVIKGLQRHISLEKDSINTAKTVSDKDLIRKTDGLKELIKKWRKDEEEHHKSLRNLVGKAFFATGDDPFALFKTPEELEERYSKYERRRLKGN
jgi:Txe/YoeB family toxin of Txe-Axe toxin-antitoxin module